jgi:hypothetical protein
MRKMALALALMPVTAMFSVTVAQAQTAPATKLVIDKKRIDAALAAMIADGRAAGTSALIWQDGREVYFGTAGMADREAKRPMRRDTIAQIYSMTKPVTGVALMQLWEQGKFRLDDPLARNICPNMPICAFMQARMPRASRAMCLPSGRSPYATSCATPRASPMAPGRRPRMTPMSPPNRSR